MLDEIFHFAKQRMDHYSSRFGMTGSTSQNVAHGCWGCSINCDGDCDSSCNDTCYLGCQGDCDTGCLQSCEYACESGGYGTQQRDW